MRHQISLINKGALTNEKLSRIVHEVIDFTPELVCEWPWSPITLKPGQNWLEQANFQSTSLLVFDIDNSPGSKTLQLHEAQQQFADYQHVIGTSRNHQLEKTTKAGKVKPAADRYRVVLFFDKEITDIETYKASWVFYCNLLGLADIADHTQDAARFFWPCRELVSVQSGKVLKPIDPTNQPKPTKVLESNVEKSKGKLSRSTLEFLSCGDDNENNWHKKFITAALELKGKNYSYEHAVSLLSRASKQLELDSTDLEQLQDVYENRSSFFDSYSLWPKMSPARNGQTAQPVRNSVENVQYLLNVILAYHLLYDIRKAHVIKSEKFGQQFDTKDIYKLRYNCMKNNLMSDESNLDVVVTMHALENAYDPFQMLFEDTLWDGEDHIQALFETLIFAPDEPADSLKWYKEFLSRWLRAMAAKYYSPGSQNNVLVFTGVQGVGKSRWLEKLASPWPDGFKEGALDPSNKDHALCHLEKFLWHIAELDNTTNNKDVGALKDFLTRGTISERRPYARLPETGKSILSFCATVNSTDFLHDNSGNRRFLVLPIIGLNANHSVNIKQVYAQAASEYKSGKAWYFNFEEIREIEKLTDLYKYKDPIQERIENALKPGYDRLTVHEIVNLVRNEADSLSYTNSRAFKIGISNLLQKRGFVPRNHSNRKVYSVNAESLRLAGLQSV